MPIFLKPTSLSLVKEYTLSGLIISSLLSLKIMKLLEPHLTHYWTSPLKIVLNVTCSLISFLAESWINLSVFFFTKNHINLNVLLASFCPSQQQLQLTVEINYYNAWNKFTGWAVSERKLARENMKVGRSFILLVYDRLITIVCIIIFFFGFQKYNNCIYINISYSIMSTNQWHVQNERLG